MALKILVAVCAFSFVTCQDIGKKQGAETTGVKTAAVTATIIPEAAPKVVAGTKSQNLPVVRAAESNEVSGSSSSGLFTLLLIALMVSAAVMMTPTSRNALITAGIVSADSELTKKALKASSDVQELANTPMVQEALAVIGPKVQEASAVIGPKVQEASAIIAPKVQEASAMIAPKVKEASDAINPLVQEALTVINTMGFLKQGLGNKEFDEEETCRPLINESDGEDEEEAELKVSSVSFSAPLFPDAQNCLHNVAENAPLFPDAQSYLKSTAPSVNGQAHLEDMIDFGPAAQENNDDFFDEDDDF